MHGGTSKGPKTKSGKDRSQMAAYRHGAHTKEARALHQGAMALIKQSKNILAAFNE